MVILFSAFGLQAHPDPSSLVPRAFSGLLSPVGARVPLTILVWRTLHSLLFPCYHLASERGSPENQPYAVCTGQGLEILTKRFL